MHPVQFEYFYQVHQNPTTQMAVPNDKTVDPILLSFNPSLLSTKY